MGEVWLAEQMHPFHRQVAVKIIKAGMDTEQVVARFEAERQTLALMDHAGIAKVLDAGSTPEGRPYFVMEYVRGEMITTYCDRYRLPLEQRVDLFTRLCDAVQHAHQKGVIHRDLKPSNVLISSSDERPEPRVIDFGISKAITTPLADRSVFTEFGAFVGTPEYMSPEQASRSLDVDTRSDIYSLGAILYELLTGVLPFDWSQLREAGVDRIREHLLQAPIPPSHRIASKKCDITPSAHRLIDAAKLSRRLKGDLDWIVMKALETDRTRRYPTANALALDLRRYLKHEPVSAGPPSALYRTSRFVRRHRLGVAAAMIVAALMIAFGVVTVAQAKRIAREAETSRRVSEFLVRLFNVSDPSESRGNTLTAREILDRGANRIDTDLADQPDVHARMMTTIGSVYLHLGLFANAQPLLERALHDNRLILGENHTDTLVTLDALAEANWRQAKYSVAERLFNELVERRRRTLGDNDAETLSAVNSLAVVLMYEERWREAEDLLTTALAGGRRLGDDHVVTLTTLNNLGSLFWRQGRYADSLPFTLKAVQGRTRALGADHPETLVSMHNLATTYDRLNGYTDAEQTYLSTIMAKRRVLGAAHSSTVLTVRRLASLYLRLRRYSDAEQQLLSCVGASNEVTSSDSNLDPVSAQLVELYEVWGKPEKAAALRAGISKESATKQISR